jgi:bile acid:Na+ symporter, BASS family
MLAAGTRLTVSGFAALVASPRMLIVATVANVALVPAVAVAIVTQGGLPGPIAYGIVLAAAAPGGGTGVLLARHARGDLTLAVALQGVLVPASLVTVPLWTLALGPGAGDAQVAGGPVLATLLLAQLLPLCAGMLLRGRWPTLAVQVRAISGRVADALLLTLTVYIAVTTAGQMVVMPVSTLAAMVAVVAVSLATYALPGLGAAPARRAVAMTATVRNMSLGLVVAGQAAEADQVALTLIAYSLVMYAMAGAAALGLRRGRVGGAGLSSEPDGGATGPSLNVRRVEGRGSGRTVRLPGSPGGGRRARPPGSPGA